MVGCCKLSLYANEEMTNHVNQFFDLRQWRNFTGIEALEFSCIYTLQRFQRTGNSTDEGPGPKRLERIIST